MIRLLPIAFMLVAGAAAAQDDGLYPTPSAPDAAFLRVHAAEGAAVAVNGQSVEPDALGLTPYVEVAPGPVTLSVDGAESTVEAPPNAHLSFVASPEGEGTLLTDAVTGSPAQADLVLLNLSDIPAVDAFVPSADAVAIAGVPAGQGAGVALRAPLTLDVELRRGDEVVATVPGVELVRSAGTTIVLTGGPGAYQAAAELNTYAD